MRKDKLAILGGEPLIKKKFKRFNTIGAEEIKEVNKVLKSGILSSYLGQWSKDFYGGERVNLLENYFQRYFKVKRAISVNSWTSGLIAAVGALDINPGDEIITTPWTMCASATSILHWNAIPIFADIEKDTFCIDPDSVRKNITKKTKAIMSVDIAGQSANIDELNKIAKEYNLKIISDTAQAPGAKYKEKFAGTLTDIGGFSLNYHKHIHTGEGGVLVTNDNKLAERMCLIRNHGEAVVEKKKTKQINNILGFNFRMGEIECAIAFQQLKKLKKNIRSRQNIAKQFDKSLSNFSGIQIPKIREGCSHVYYVYQMQIDKNFTGVHRNVILKALQAEGVENLSGKFANLHLLPIFQKKIAYGKHGFPWSFSETRKNINYNKGICPIAEKLNDETYLGFEMCTSEMQVVDINNVINAFDKVWNNLDSLRIKFKG